MEKNSDGEMFCGKCDGFMNSNNFKLHLLQCKGNFNKEENLIYKKDNLSDYQNITNNSNKIEEELVENNLGDFYYCIICEETMDIIFKNDHLEIFG